MKGPASGRVLYFDQIDDGCSVRGRSYVEAFLTVFSTGRSIEGGE